MRINKYIAHAGVASRRTVSYTHLKDFKPAVQKRKLSAVNQFLYYLYQERFISEYHRLVLPKIQPAKTQDVYKRQEQEIFKPMNTHLSVYYLV